MDAPYYIVTFVASEGLATGRRALVNEGLNVDTVPLPKMVSAGYNVAIRFDPKDYDTVKRVLRESGAPFMDFFEVEQVGSQQCVELL